MTFTQNSAWQYQPVTVYHHGVLLQGRSVLLAEDNLINQRVAKMMLCSLGMCCEVASNGQEAVAAVKRRMGQEDVRQFDVLLMDMAMPVMGGVDATKVSLLHMYWLVEQKWQSVNINKRPKTEGKMVSW